MFDEIKGGGPGGEATRESRVVWGAARPPNITEQQTIIFN